MDKLYLMTHKEIAQKMGLIKHHDLISGVNNLSSTSLNNLRRANPTKYEIVMLGLIVKQLKINFNDLMFLSQAKNIKNKNFDINDLLYINLLTNYQKS